MDKKVPRSSVVRNWTDQQLLEELRSKSLINRVRQEFSAGCGQIEQAQQQRTRPTPIEVRRMEFEIAQKIILLILGEPGLEVRP